MAQLITYLTLMKSHKNERTIHKGQVEVIKERNSIMSIWWNGRRIHYCMINNDFGHNIK